MTKPTYGRELLPQWLLDPTARHLNHGGYGAVPRVVQEVEFAWKARMEASPTAFFQDILPPAVREAAMAVARFVGTSPDRLAFVENATAGTNAVLNSLSFQAGDEVLISDHVYNAVLMNLHHIAARTGIRIVEAQIGLPIQGSTQITAAFKRHITDKTRLIIADHVVSASAVIMPIAEIAAAGKAAGIPVLVDGAHAPGMVDLDVDAIGATWYVCNLHKWLCAPRGAAFIARAADAPEIHPAVISHGFGQGFTAEFDFIGTRNAAPWLAAPAAIAFHERLGGAALRLRNHDLAVDAGDMLARAFGTETGAPAAQLGSMATVRLPTTLEATRQVGWTIRRVLWNEHRIEVPFTALSGALWLRISCAPYNDMRDYEDLPGLVMDAIKRL